VDITVYLPAELGAWAKANRLNLSGTLRAAVEAEQERRRAVEATLADAKTTDLTVDDDEGYSYTARIHGVLIADQVSHGSEDAVEVYLGRDGKIYVYQVHQSKLWRGVPANTLRHWLDNGPYVAAMRALGEEVVIDIGLPPG
jgi:post-segregation antitoxin (ccd killing protein)